ncbi:MAG: prepilin peptidase [Proteobacteria bacterium]|nr:prepilin peptidase [Pseudomonadota bacterium]
MGAIVTAPVFGSFLAVVAIRLSRDANPLAGRSACDACGARLSAFEMIPLLSYAVRRGRCAHCGAAIDVLHPVVEAGALAVALWAAAVTGGWIVIASCVLGWTLLTLSAIDARTGYLPDVLTLPLIAVGLVVAWLIDPAIVVEHLIGAAAGFAVFAVLGEVYRRLRGRDGLGLGDAKLLAAAGAWLGWRGLPTVVLLAALAGLAFVLFRRMRGEDITAADRLAFGPALALGIWLVWLYGPLVPG